MSWINYSEKRHHSTTKPLEQNCSVIIDSIIPKQFSNIGLNNHFFFLFLRSKFFLMKWVDRGNGPLPSHLQKIRDNSVPLFVFNLSEKISKTELESMFCLASQILDSFIPSDRSFKRSRGFAFVKFMTMREAARDIEMATGTSWGGRRIQVSISKDKRQKDRDKRWFWLR